MNNLKIPTLSLFKWIGGKKWLKKNLTEQTETFSFKDKDTYIEPFVGGMGSFLSIYPILEKNNFKTIILNDINVVIIDTYKLIKENPKYIIKELEILEEQYEFTIDDKSTHLLNKTKDKDLVKEKLKDAQQFYLKVRLEFNEIKLKANQNEKDKVRLSSLFLFLQDHSFNGVYRENSSGKYNTPFNWDPKLYKTDTKTKTILDYYHFFNDSHIIFENLDVFELLNKYSESYNKSFIYLDPPYLNSEEENSNNENKYNKKHFGRNEQNLLLEKLEHFSCFLYSNHLLNTFKEYFSKENHSYISVNRKNIMTSKVTDRSNEVLEILAKKEL